MADEPGRLARTTHAEGVKYDRALPALVATQASIQRQVEGLINRHVREAISRKDYAWMPGYPVVYARVKQRDSCLERIAERHETLEELPDLIGCRVVVIHTGELELVDSALEGLLKHALPEPIEHDEGLGRSRGYSGVHYTIRLGENDWIHRYCTDVSAKRRRMAARFRWELQIHTVMQEAWSRVSHAGFYKNREGVPKNVQRKLQRLASTSKLLDDHLMDLSLSIRQEQTVLRTKFAKREGRLTLEPDEYLLQHCQENNRYAGQLRCLRELAARAGFQCSEWPGVVEIGDETDICLEVCRRTQIKTWGDLQAALDEIESEQHRWEHWLAVLVRRCDDAKVRIPFDRAWLVFSIIRLLGSPHMPTIDLMYPPLWQQIAAVHRELSSEKAG
ncbi:RelA/SpoT domain-containing protein [Mycobacterium sp.]|uniref:RelA/SpoT domain-containing protein n=1 Tax=Mycobacterium sp. TaxID=1785 RepID=UPI002D892355|nr:RelA/SpoT domain-containing protein [Mycobacterium sp.]